MSGIVAAPVTLIGRFVRLDPMRRAHAAALHRAGAFPEIWAYMPVHPRSAEDVARIVDDAMREEASGAQLPFVIASLQTGDIVGSTRLMAISRHDRRVEIGWTWLTPSAQRSAANTECKYLLLRHCFETLGCHRVELKTDRRNERSQRAIERIGATREGVLRKHMVVQDGYQRDSVYFRIIDDEWPAVRGRLESMLAGVAGA